MNQMNAHINEDELRVLTYLHENAEGFGNRHRIDAHKMMVDLGLDLKGLWKSGSFLEELGLVGIVGHDISRMDDPERRKCYTLEFFYLTGLGESYCRELEAQPGMPKQLTIATLKGLGN